MPSNLRRLRNETSNQSLFYDKFHAMSLELTPESINLSCYWAKEKDGGSVTYYGKTLGCWSPNDPSGSSYREAYRCIRNALEYVKRKAHSWIESDLQIYEHNIKLGKTNPITPPLSETSSNRKRRYSKAESEQLSRCTSQHRGSDTENAC